MRGFTLYWLRIGPNRELTFASRMIIYTSCFVYRSSIGSLSGNMLRLFACAWRGPAIRKVLRGVSVRAISLALSSCHFRRQTCTTPEHDCPSHSFTALQRLRLALGISRRVTLHSHQTLLQ